MVDTLLISSVLLLKELKIFFSFFWENLQFYTTILFNCQVDIPIQFIIIMTIPIPIIYIPILIPILIPIPIKKII